MIEKEYVLQRYKEVMEELHQELTYYVRHSYEQVYNKYRYGSRPVEFYRCFEDEDFDEGEFVRKCSSAYNIEKDSWECFATTKIREIYEDTEINDFQSFYKGWWKSLNGNEKKLLKGKVDILYIADTDVEDVGDSYKQKTYLYKYSKCKDEDHLFTKYKLYFTEQHEYFWKNEGDTSYIPKKKATTFEDYITEMESNVSIKYSYNKKHYTVKKHIDTPLGDWSFKYNPKKDKWYPDKDCRKFRDVITCDTLAEAERFQAFKELTC